MADQDSPAPRGCQLNPRQLLSHPFRRVRKVAKLPRRAYDRYIGSAEWTERRTAFLRAHPDGCAVCGFLSVDVHHLDYGHLGAELDDDLLALCKAHHDGVHAFHDPRSDRLTLREATSIYVCHEGGNAPPPGEPFGTMRNHAAWIDFVTAPCPTCGAAAGESCWYENRGRVRLITAGLGHKARRGASTGARRDVPRPGQ